MSNYWLNTEEARLIDWGIQMLLDKQIGAPDVQDRLAALKINLLNQNNLTGRPHPTEEKYPEQTKRFREILDELYQTHLKKNNDYSKWNILGVGIVGLTTRFWDKTCRIMNLVGFDIETGEYTGAKKNLVLDESVIDTFRDAGVYSIIARVWVEGKWGK